jgi:hypothetical protein
MRRVAVLAALLLAPASARAAAAGVQLSFDKENTALVSSAAFQGGQGAFAGANHRVYYIRASTEVFSAKTADGLAFVEEAGVRLSSLTVPLVDVAVTSITGLSVLPLNAGGYRMAYSVTGTTGAYNIYTATSADGLSWANDTGTAIAGGTTFVGLPSLVELQSGDWMMYFVGNAVAGNQAANHQIYAALSTNEGRNWGSPFSVVAQRAGEVSATLLSDNKVRLYWTAPVVGGSSNTTVLSALSTDANGTSFTVEQGVRLSTSPGTIISPFVERTTDTYRWRLYYDYSPTGVSTGDAYSAVTDAPQLKAVSPASVTNTRSNASLTITGEVFSTGITALLQMGGQPNIVGGGLVRSDDQTLTGTFATIGATPGLWDLVLTNANGLSTTVSGAVLIDFPGGSAVLTDNLFRPRQGGSLRVDVTTYSQGHVTAKLYTLDGRFLSTLYDAETPAGTQTLHWAGTTASGATVASGVYILRVKGPHLDSVNKVVVIK